MKRVSTAFETLISVLILTLGLYWLKEGISNKTWLASASLIAGATFFSLGFITLYFAVRSVLSHRATLRHATGGHRVGKAVSSHNDGV
jgi:asparagine N-glycosylation enzyme membrane subunit Stt3